jgi:LysM repeat protein
MRKMSFFLNYSFLAFFLIFFFPAICLSQNNAKPDYNAYISLYKDIAIREMKLFKIPASITLAQGIIESNCGLSPLATEANNHFGIKCHKDWTGEKFHYDDDEKQECFRKYNNPEESFRDHSLFLVNRPRYAALFSLDSNDYTGWAMGLKQAGYATNPQYPSILIRTIEMNRLYIYDNANYIGDSTNNQSPAIEEPTQSIPPISFGNKLFKPGYRMPAPADFKLRKESPSGRKVFENNGIPLVFAQKGDTWYSLAKEFNVYASQLQKENDMPADLPISVGQIIYLEPKKRKCSQSVHKFRDTDTFFSISQEYGIKLKVLLKYNKLDEPSELEPGTIIQLHSTEKHLF